MSNIKRQIERTKSEGKPKRLAKARKCLETGEKAIRQANGDQRSATAEGGGHLPAAQAVPVSDRKGEGPIREDGRRAKRSALRERAAVVSFPVGPQGATTTSPPKFDKRTYMRNYMRKRRLDEKAADE